MAAILAVTYPAIRHCAGRLECSAGNHKDWSFSLNRSFAFSAFLGVCALSFPLMAHADSLVFDLSPTNNVTQRLANSGPAQGVIVGTTTTISSFSFYAATPTAENLKFFIDSADGTSVLFSRVVSAGANSALSWLSSGSLSFTLNAGSEYFFGVVGDGQETDLGYISPPTTYTANGLTADMTGNTNVNSFASPTFNPASRGAAEIGLRLYTGGTTATTPEPSSLMLLGTGALGVLGAARRRFKSGR